MIDIRKYLSTIFILLAILILGTTIINIFISNLTYIFGLFINIVVLFISIIIIFSTIILIYLILLYFSLFFFFFFVFARFIHFLLN